MPLDFLDPTTYQMVRDLNVVISNATDAEIKGVVQNHAFPRVKFRLLTATDTLGRNIFYGRITDLTDPDIQKAAEILLSQVIAVDVVQDGLRRIIAALTCSWMTSQIAAQVENQANYAKKLEKEALSDLDYFIKSPILGGVVSAIRATVVDNYQARSFGLGLDLDPSTVDTVHLTANTYSGAQIPGMLRLYLDGLPIVVQVAAGDTPATILRKLSLMTVQKAGLRQVELISMDKSDPINVFNRIWADPNSGTVYPIAISTQVTEATLQGRNSSGVQAAIASMSLVSFQKNIMVPGLPGLLIGYSDTYDTYGQSLNPVVLADVPGADFILPTDSSVRFNPADLLCFQTVSPLSKLKQDGTQNVLKYQISQVVNGNSPNNNPLRNNGEVTILIQDGWQALDLVEIVAQDLAKRRATQNVLGAVYPVISVQDPKNNTILASAINLIGYTADQEVEVKFMFQITAMPEGLNTALARQDYSANIFNTDPDSVVIHAITLGRTEIVDFNSSGLGGASAVEAVTSRGMNQVLDFVKRMIATGR